MDKIISFIITAYNVEPYLKKCLDSFLIDGGWREKIEVIVVNDGSTDRTSYIAQAYAELYPSVYRVIDKENGGHGSAINVGSKQAAGKFIKIVDADDWVLTENLVEFLSALEECQADVVLNPYHQVDMKTGQKIGWPMYCDCYNQNVGFEEMVSHLRDYENCLTFHGITYRLDFYRKYYHELPEKVFYEDQEYAAIPCCHAKQVYPMDLFLYQYLVGNENQSVSAQNRLKRLNHHEKVIEDLIIYRKQQECLSGAGKDFLDKKINSMIMTYYMLVCIIQKDKKAGRNSMSAFDRRIQALDSELCRKIAKREKLFLIMSYLHVSESLYQKILASTLYHVIKKKSTIK